MITGFSGVVGREREAQDLVSRPFAVRGETSIAHFHTTSGPLALRVVGGPPTVQDGIFIEGPSDGCVVLGAIANRAALAEALDLAPDAAVSDAELLYRLHRKMSAAAFKIAVGPFAAVLINRGAIVLVSAKTAGPTLYVGATRRGPATCFASEIKALAGKPELTGELPERALFADPTLTPFDGVRRILPGHHLRLDGSATAPAQRMYYSPLGGVTLCDEPTAIAALHRALERAVERLARPDSAVLVSGGLDSSVVAYLTKQRHGALRTYSLGSERYNEFPFARRLAEDLGTLADHHEVIVDDSRMIQHVVDTTYCLEHALSRYIEYVTPVHLGFAALAGRESRVLSGYGSDILFGGLAERGASLASVVDFMEDEYTTTSWANELSHVLRGSLGLDVAYPYWDDGVVATAMAIAPGLRYRPPIEKYILRKAFDGEICKETLWREKLGIHQGTGSERIVSEYLGLDPERMDPGLIRRRKDRFCHEILRCLLGDHVAPAEVDRGELLAEARRRSDA